MIRTPLSVENPITRLVAIAAAVALIAFGIFAFTTSASAPRAGADVTYPVIVPVAETSAQTCTSLGAILVTAGYLESAPTWTQAKIDPPVNGSDGPFTVSNMDNSEPPSFDWSSTQPMNIVFVKSGSGASQIYFYNPATGATSGTGLTTANGKQVSNIVACYGTFATTTTEATTTTTEATTTTTEATTTSTSTSTSTSTVPSTTSTSTSTTVPTTSTSVSPTTTEATTTTTEADTTTTSSVLGSTTISTPDSSTPDSSTPTTAANEQAAEVLGATQAPTGALPYTGSESGRLLVAGGSVLAGGLLLVMLARRRNA